MSPMDIGNAFAAPWGVLIPWSWPVVRIAAVLVIAGMALETWVLVTGREPRGGARVGLTLHVFTVGVIGVTMLMTAVSGGTMYSIVVMAAIVAIGAPLVLIAACIDAWLVWELVSELRSRSAS